MLINNSIKKAFPGESKNFGELEDHYKEVQKRLYARSVSHARDKRPLGANSINYLLSALVRSKNLLEGFALALENENALTGFLVVRAHYETTGAVAFFLRHLTRFNETKDKEQLSEAIRRMTLGMRVLPNKNDSRYGRVPKIDNVMNYIDEVDTVIKKISTVRKSLFRTNYDFLSEFCHPNAFGLMVGSRTIHSRVVEYELRPRLLEKDLRVLLWHLLRSSFFFPRLYDTAWRIVEDNFELPELQKYSQ